MAASEVFPSALCPLPAAESSRLPWQVEQEPEGSRDMGPQHLPTPQEPGSGVFGLVGGWLMIQNSSN